MKNTVYFDNAATGYPKPDCVVNSVVKSFREFGNPGRSGHELSLNASKAIYSCREKICDLLNFDSPERVIFTMNATHALNIAIKGIVEKKSHIIISNFEHNSVLRPIYALCSKENNEMKYTVFDASHDDKTTINNFKKSINKDTKLAVVTVVSNICGKILPVEKIAKICRNNNIRLILDASQAVGEIDIDLNKIGADILCSSGHKGLYGPMGTGFAVFGNGIEIEPILEGGNGVRSLMPDMGNVFPENLESGTPNVPGICGLGAGIDYVRSLGINSIREKTSKISSYISDGLKNEGAHIYGEYINKTPIVLFNIDQCEGSEVSGFLDEKRIFTRSGFHCAPLAHNTLGTLEIGAVRVSIGHGNTMREADIFLREIREYIKNKDHLNKICE